MQFKLATCLEAIPVAIGSLRLLAVITVAIDCFSACGGQVRSRYALIIECRRFGHMGTDHTHTEPQTLL